MLGEDGHDPFLENSQTLWLIHWNLSTDLEHPLLAWDYLLNRWQEPELTRSEALKAIHREASKIEEATSLVTLEQHLDAFLHTYLPTRGKKGEIQEDNLDCPLIELELLVKVGDREQEAGKRESIYTFRREEKDDISSELFTYCLNEFWQKRHANEKTLNFKEVACGYGSPGQIFKLPEDDIRSRIEELNRQPKGAFTYTENANLQQLRKERPTQSLELLNEIYSLEGAHDFNDPSVFSNYVATDFTQTCLARLANGLRKMSGQRAWRMTGDYCAGNHLPLQL